MKYKYTLTICSLILSASVFSAVYAENSQVSLSDGIDTKINIQADLNHNQDDRSYIFRQRSDLNKNSKWIYSKRPSKCGGRFCKITPLVLQIETEELERKLELLPENKMIQSTTTIQAMDKVEQRSGFKTFWLGADYRNFRHTEKYNSVYQWSDQTTPSFGR